MSAAMLLLLFWAAAAISEPPPAELFQQSICDMEDYDVAAVQFEHNPDLPHRISFSNRAQLSAVYLGHFTDIAIDWPRIRAIYLSPAGNDPSRAMFAIDFDPDTNIRPLPFKFGLIARDCFKALSERYGASLKFVDQTAGQGSR